MISNGQVDTLSLFQNRVCVLQRGYAALAVMGGPASTSTHGRALYSAPPLHADMYPVFDVVTRHLLLQ